MALSDQLIPPDQPGLDAQPASTISSSYPPNMQKPPMPGPQPYPPPSVHHLHSQSADNLPHQPNLQPLNLSQNTQANVPLNVQTATAPYTIPAEDLNKEDVIFF